MVGLPLFFLELAIGQMFQQGAWGAFRKMSPAAAGIGGASMLVSLQVGIYYNMIIAYCLYYLGASMHKTLPWDGFECREVSHFWSCAELENKTQTELYWNIEVSLVDCY